MQSALVSQRARLGPFPRTVNYSSFCFGLHKSLQADNNLLWRLSFLTANSDTTLNAVKLQVRSRQQMRCISCKSAVSENIKSKIARVTGGDPAHITPQDLYQGAAHSVRDELFDEFNTTNKYFEYVASFLGLIHCVSAF